MIVVDGSGDSLLLVRQPDHAVTCAAMATSWRRPTRIEADLWSRFIEAVRRHDDGWRDVEQSPALDSDGRPVDFKTIATARHVGIWRRGVDEAGDDPYAALLIALHARWLYTHVEQDSLNDKRRAQVFVDQITLGIDELIEQLSAGSAPERDAVQPHMLSAARRLFSFFDALSLALIGALPWFERSDELMFADRQVQLTISPAHAPAHGGELHMDPWPLSVAQLPLATAVTRLGRRTFGDENELARSIARSGQTQLQWRLTPG